ncbi:MAG: hypothetical protein HXX11_06095 [Desulfuromonadales bacterium]|nr:hypothetical protein [Desulfuromonadales bacterium]
MKKIYQYKSLWIISAIPVFILYCWLNWGLLPNLAIVHLEDSGEPIPKSGYLLVHKNGSRLDGHRVIETFERGWSGVAASWPYHLSGIMIGLLPGMIISELSRRIYEKATSEAQAEAEKVKNEARVTESAADHRLRSAKKMEDHASEQLDAAARQHKENQKMRMEFEGMKCLHEGKLKNAESTANELKKARNKIRRLEDKISRMEEENPIDWP